MGPIDGPEKSVRNYHYNLRNIAEEGTFQFPIASFGKLFRHLTVKYRLSLKVHNQSIQYFIISGD